VTTVMVAGGSLVAYGAYRNVADSIKHVNVNQLLGQRPVKYNSALNILVIGSDSRAGAGAKFGTNISGARSDTMLLLHILPQRQGAVVISFPRDSIVPIMACAADGIGDPGQPASSGTEMLNATFAYGGAPCLWKTLEATTGIFIDHFMQIDFTGFQSVVNDLGGVNVCLPETINDPMSGLKLTAGLHHVNGQQALAFVRERHVGLGSDLQRIQRQQFFIASVLQQVESTNMLSSAPKMFKIATDASRSLTTDSGLSIGTMLTIAQSMKGLSTKAVQLTQVPVVNDPSNANRVDWVQPQAAQLFSEVAHDKKVTKAATSTVTTVSPAKVKVQVMNGTATAGLAGTTATSLTQRGYDVTGTGNAATTAATTIEYGSATEAPEVNTLKGALVSAQVKQVAGLAPGTIALVVGSNFTSLKTVAAPTSTASSGSLKNVTKTFGGITANTNICKDSGAFTGPDVPADFAGG